MENNNITTGAVTTISSYGASYSNSITALTNSKTWNDPIFKEVNEVGESIEMIYTQTSSVYAKWGLPPYEDERVMKIVYSCVDGKWNKSEPIYGKIIPAQGEYYEFED